MSENETIELFLAAVARHSTTQFPGSAEVVAGVTLVRARRAAVVASSGLEASQLDEVESGFDEGPSLSAARTGQTVVVQDLQTDPRWPDYLASVSGLGFSSVLSVPLATGADGGAALNLYARPARYFTRDLISAVERYAAEAALTLDVAVQIAEFRDSKQDLMAAMSSRTSIDIAIGIIVGQNQCSQAEAFQILQRASGNQNVKLRALAERLIATVTEQKITTHFEG